MSSSAATGVSRGWAVHRSVTLLRVFLLASAVILVCGAISLGSLLTTALRSQALDDASSSLTQYVDGVLRPELVRGDGIHVSRDRRRVRNDGGRDDGVQVCCVRAKTPRFELPPRRLLRGLLRAFVDEDPRAGRVD